MNGIKSLSQMHIRSKPRNRKTLSYLMLLLVYVTKKESSLNIQLNSIINKLCENIFNDMLFNILRNTTEKSGLDKSNSTPDSLKILFSMNRFSFLVNSYFI